MSDKVVGLMLGFLLGMLIGAIIHISGNPPLTWIDNLPVGSTIQIASMHQYTIKTPSGNLIIGRNLPAMIKALAVEENK